MRGALEDSHRRIFPCTRSERWDIRRTVAEGRAALAKATFPAVWAEGQAMSLDQAIQYALGEA